MSHEGISHHCFNQIFKGRVRFIVGVCAIALMMLVYARHLFAQNNSNGVSVLTLGAKCDGSSDDTAVFQSAINLARNSSTGASIVIPQGTPGCVVRQLDITNSQSHIRFVGGGSVNGNQSSILCRELQADTGVCMDFSGTDSFNVENLKIVGGSTAATAPQVTVLMGKSTTSSGSLANGSQIAWSSVSVVSNGDYGVYNYGGEVWTCDQCYFRGQGVADVMLSGANSAGIASAFASLLSPPVSMTAVHFHGATFGTGASTVGVLLDPMAAQGLISDISFSDGYSHLQGPAFIADTVPPNTQSVIAGIRITGWRAEAFGSSTVFAAFNSVVSQITVDAAYISVQPGVTPLQFNGNWGAYSVTVGDINLRPGGWNGSFPPTVVQCRGNTKGLVIHDFVAAGGKAMHNVCPGATQIF